MTALAVLVLEFTACVGLGGTALRLLGLLGTLQRGEKVAWGFAVGYGILGWLLFFVGVAGLFSPIILGALLIICTGGLIITMRGESKVVTPEATTPYFAFDWMLVGALGLALVFDLFEGLTPPVDGDTLAYHFALPKQFMELGRLTFVPRAMDGAVPLLNQMTYIPALSLGGERALTLWTMVSGWMATYLLFQISRHYLDRRWSLAIAAIFLTTPAVVYGGGGGQVEVRNAMFAMVAAFAVADAVRTGRYRYAVLAGLGVGFFMAGKYIGLLYALACGLAILRQRHWFRHGFVLTAVAFVAGGQWYVWNWLHIGDPFFPMLYGLVDYSGLANWTNEQNEALRGLLATLEKAVPTSVFWALAYPFVATIKGYPVFESGRTGFGPFILLTLPFALAGTWHYRDKLKSSPLLTVALITGIFYAAWFFSGSSQRVRQLLPALPLLLVCIGVAAARWAAAAGMAKPLAASVLITLGLQFGGHGLFSLGFIEYALKDQSRENYLRRYLTGYDTAAWVNEHLQGPVKLYTRMRYLNYLLKVPYLYSHAQQEGQIYNARAAADAKLFYSQLKSQSITHLAVFEDPYENTPPHKGGHLWRPLLAAGCLDKLAEIDVTSLASRTLQISSTTRNFILKMNDRSCKLP
jgi:hypothetical protein